MSISTKYGDDGTTALLFNRRVAKTHPRVRTYGRVDELNSALGLCRIHTTDTDTKAIVLQIQKELINLMGELATDDPDQERYLKKFSADAISATMVKRLTSLVYAKEEAIGGFAGWVIPGDSIGQAYFDAARTACRRAERGVVNLRDTGALVRSELIHYLNRLADLLWLLSREHL